MKFLVMGANLRNRGAEAMLMTTVSELRVRCPGACVTAATYSKGDFPLLGRVRREVQPGRYQEFDLVPAVRGLSDLVLRVLSLMGSLGRSFAAARSPFVAALQDADIVIDISGFSLSDRRPLWRSVVFALESACCRRLKVPLVLLTQAFGPFERSGTRVCAKYVLRQSSLVFARGELSAGFLSELGCRRGIDFHVASDIAWLFPPIVPAEPQPLPHRPRLGVVPNTNIERAYERNGGVNQYIAAMSSLCVFAHERLGANVVLIGHEILDQGDDDDALCEAICAATPERARPAIVSGRRPAAELKAIIGECDFLVTSRFHALIAAQSQGVPTLSVGWAHKYEESSLDVGRASRSIEFGIGTRNEALAEALALAWAEREGVRASLLELRGPVQASASQPFDQLFKLIAQLPLRK